MEVWRTLGGGGLFFSVFSTRLVQKGEQLAVSRSPPLRRGSDSHSLKMESLEALDGGGGRFARFSSFFHYILHSIIMAGSREVSVVFVGEQGHGETIKQSYL